MLCFMLDFYVDKECIDIDLTNFLPFYALHYVLRCFSFFDLV